MSAFLNLSFASKMCSGLFAVGLIILDSRAPCRGKHLVAYSRWVEFCLDMALYGVVSACYILVWQGKGTPNCLALKGIGGKVLKCMFAILMQDQGRVAEGK